MTPEARIRNEICAWLKWKRVFVFVHDAVGLWNPTRGAFMTNRNPHRIRGVSDLLGIYNGRPLAIEVKAGKGRLSEHQAAFLQAWRDAGGIGFVARSISDCERELKKHDDERSLRGILGVP